MGTYRLLLAIMVMFSHVGYFPVPGVNEGAVAVISFYLLSGYVMTMLMTKYFATISRVPFFYVDRAARLLPQLYFYMFVGLVLVLVTNVPVHYLSRCTAQAVSLNFLVVPLDFFNHWNRLSGVGTCQLDPPAWSLGLELTFYFFAPAILFLPKLTRLAAFASIAIFLYAWLGYINLFVFGYTLLPGTLFIFLLGASFAKPGLVQKNLQSIVWLSAIFMLLALRVFPTLGAIHLSFEILVGLIIGIPALAFLSKVEKPGNDSHWSRLFMLDERLGNYSYGVFLNHYLLTWLVLLSGSAPTAHLPAFTLGSFVLSIMSFHFIEAPVLRRRRAIRYKKIGSSTASFVRIQSGWRNQEIAALKSVRQNTVEETILANPHSTMAV